MLTISASKKCEAMGKIKRDYMYTLLYRSEESNNNSVMDVDAKEISKREHDYDEKVRCPAQGE